MSERLLIAKELGELLGLSASTILDWHEAGRIPSFRLGGRKGVPVRFKLSEIEAWLDEGRCGPKVDRRPQGVG
jgi:excisionase family DNA binding protein